MEPGERSDNLRDYLNHLSEHHFGFGGVDFTDLNFRNSEGENALHAAAVANEVEAAKELIGLGVDLEAKGDLGKTPMHIAASRGHLEIFEALVEAGASLVVRDESGLTPLFVAELMGQDEIVRFALHRLFTEPEGKRRDIWKSYRRYHEDRIVAIDEQLREGQDGSAEPPHS